MSGYTRDDAYRDLLAWVVSDAIMSARLRWALGSDLSRLSLATRLAIVGQGDHRDVWVYDELVDQLDRVNWGRLVGRPRQVAS